MLFPVRGVAKRDTLWKGVTKRDTLKTDCYTVVYVVSGAHQLIPVYNSKKKTGKNP